MNRTVNSANSWIDLYSNPVPCEGTRKLFRTWKRAEETQQLLLQRRNREMLRKTEGDSQMLTTTTKNNMRGTEIISTTADTFLSATTAKLYYHNSQHTRSTVTTADGDHDQNELWAPRYLRVSQQALEKLPEPQKL